MKKSKPLPKRLSGRYKKRVVEKHVKNICMYRLGACNDCHIGIKNIKYGWSKRLPKYSIVNKNYFGSLPPELSCLNEVELELCKYNKIGGHIFSLYGGAHTSIRGHHTL